MRNNIFQAWLFLLVSSLILWSCKKWEDHTAITDPRVEKDLFQQIKEKSELSKFAEMLTKTGYDKEIASSKTYTVFAPTDAALASLDPSLIADDQKLHTFVANHIIDRLQSTSVSGQVRLQMLSGKYNNFLGGKIEDATITVKDQYARNGYLQIIDKVLPVLANAWEFLQTGQQVPAQQKNFLLSLTDQTGANTFLSRVHDLRNESKQYTFFILNDTAWNKEVTKYLPFYPTGTVDSTTLMASTAVVSDFAVEGVYQVADLPDTILSKFNTKIGIEKNAIVQTVKVSNGIVHIMNKLDVLPKHKFQSYIIQGENYDFSRLDRRNNTYFRDKFNPVTGKDFRDVLVFGHGTSEFYLGFRLINVPALKFKAYWVALHDNINNNTGTFKQLLGIGGFATKAGTLDYVTVSPNNYNEVYLGEFTLSTFNPQLNIYLTADKSTNSDANKVTVDYIRLEPVL